MTHRSDPSPEISVVIPFLSDLEELAKCLKSLEDQTKSPTEVFLIDNASGEDLEMLLRSSSLEIKSIRNSRNRGFAPAVNQGIEVSRSAFVLVLNADVELDRNYLEVTSDSLIEDPKAAGSTGKLVKMFQENHLDSTGHVIFKDRRVKDRGEWELDIERTDTIDDVFSIPATAALYRRSALDEAREASGDFFDEEMFSYYEDVDLAWRLRLLGWHLLYTSACTAKHRRAISSTLPSARTLVLLHRNRLLSMIKNDAPRSVLKSLVSLVITEVRMFVYYMLHHPSVPFVAWLEFFRLLPLALEKRRSIQSATIVDPASLHFWFERYDYRRILRDVISRLGTRQKPV